MTKQKLISIIIPTKNEEINIKRCLSSIKNNTYKNYEVIIVDQSSTDKTTEIGLEFGSKIIVTKPTKDYLPPSNSRNLGFKESKGEYIYHLDADMELDNNLLEEIVSIFKNSEIGAIVVPENDIATNIWAKAKAFERSLYLETNMEAARVSRREIFEKTKYDSEIFSGEDWNIHDEFSKLSKIGRTKSGVRHYLNNISLKKEFYKKFNYGKGSNKYIVRKKADLYKKLEYLGKSYIKAIISNLITKPIVVLSFIILRTVDLAGLTFGALFSNKK